LKVEKIFLDIINYTAFGFMWCKNSAYRQDMGSHLSYKKEILQKSRSYHAGRRGSLMGRTHA
jgi:hypothetical protein